MLKQKRSRTRGNPPTLTVKDENNQDKVLETKNHTRLLVGNIGNYLSWKSHLEDGEKAVLPKLRKQLGALNMIADNIPRKSRLNLANGLLLSRIGYLIQVWGGAHQTHLDKVQVILNKAARFVLRKNRMTSTNTLMKECNWLSVAELTNYKSLISMWTLLNKNSPGQILESISINDENLLNTRPPRLQTVAGGWKWRTISIWNQLTPEVRTTNKITVLKKTDQNMANREKTTQSWRTRDGIRTDTCQLMILMQLHLPDENSWDST